MESQPDLQAKEVCSPSSRRKTYGLLQGNLKHTYLIVLILGLHVSFLLNQDNELSVRDLPGW
jgi:hypothetical protein